MAGLGQADGAVWLDVTRLITRIGRGALTGVDRVELAYLRQVLTLPADRTRFLCRTTRGYLLLDRQGGTTLAALATGDRDPGRADLISRLLLRADRPRHRVEGMLRPHAVDRCVPSGLARMVARHGAKGRLSYLNVGHTNLSGQTLGAFRDFQIAVMVHDLIPILHPATVARDMPARFAKRLENVRTHADIVICNSDVTRAELAAHWGTATERPILVPAPLGLDRSTVGQADRDPNAFVMLGTIEARKNHALMLDVWDILQAELPKGAVPHLHIIGPRGWRVEDLLRRLDTHPLRGAAIFEHGPLSDAEVARHLAGARALLFPSLAEGYGLPPLEALALRTLPIVADLPVLRETLGARAVYLSGKQAYPWVETIKKLLDGSLQVPDLTGFSPPTWADHFETVGRTLARFASKGRE